MKRFSVIYDGQCVFCGRSVEWLRKLDCFRVLEFFDSHDQQTMMRKFPSVRPEDVEKTMLVVTEESVVFKGFYAFRRLIWVSPWLWSLIPIFYFPGASFLGTRLYAWIAENRKSFGCRAEWYES
ncbi:MAG TPA: DUF393 domain-containing protein [Candidatus Binatia bacterium]|jgi:predicted DCC family thiol-disulfide oxidoreductase YuxK|nr:DUF393 domain-containing protein [Candidatus Binatia bacterium]